MTANTPAPFRDDMTLSAPGLHATAVALFQPARYRKAACSLPHLPFLFWLVAAHRPTHCCTLGLDSGVAHFAMCQALSTLEGTRVAHGILDETPAYNADDVSRYSQKHYEDISVLHPSDAAPEFGGKTVDLLLVEHAITADLIAQVEADWLPVLSDKGLIVMFGHVSAQDDPALASALARLCEAMPHFEIHSGGGLVLLAPATTLPESISALINSTPPHAPFAPALDMLETLGAIYEQDTSVHDADPDPAQVQAHQDRFERDLARVEAAALRQQLDGAHGLSPQPSTVPTASLTGDLLGEEDFLDRLHLRNRRIAELHTTLETLTQTNADLEAARATRFAELAVLTQKLEQKDTQIATYERDSQNAISLARRLTLREARIQDLLEEISRRRYEYGQLQARLSRREADLASLHAQVDAPQPHLPRSRARRALARLIGR
ncbi:hypothetical protein ERN12_16375 [Rhodobacteraceae bacterium]|nr:hypothetical protein ERN12_16375 [Paracoccaceae bacterium]